jgi:hypothetical protein
VFIEDLFDLPDGSRVIRVRDGLIDLLPLFRCQWLPEIVEGSLNLPHLKDKRL